MMEMLVFSFLGSALAFFALSASTSAATSAQAAQTAAGLTWPPTQAQQDALETQIAMLVQEVSSSGMTTTERAHLHAALQTAPQEYVATLPAGMAPTLSGYQAWVMMGAAGNLAPAYGPASGAGG